MIPVWEFIRIKTPRLIKKCPVDGIKYPLSFAGQCDSDFSDLQLYCEDHEKWVSGGICVRCAALIRESITVAAKLPASARNARVTESGDLLKTYLDLATNGADNATLQSAVTDWRETLIHLAQGQTRAVETMDLYRQLLRILPGEVQVAEELSRLEQGLPLIKAKARELMDAGRFVEAAGQLTEAVKHYPEEPVLVEMLKEAGRLQVMLAKLAQEIKTCRTKLEFFRLQELLNESALWRHLIDGYDALLADSKDALTRAKALTDKAEQWVAAVDVVQGEKYFQEALAVCADFPPALAGLAKLWQGREKVTQFRRRTLLVVGTAALIGVILLGIVWATKSFLDQRPKATTSSINIRPLPPTTPVPVPTESTPVTLLELFVDPSHYLNSNVRIAGVPVVLDEQRESFEIRQVDRSIPIFYTAFSKAEKQAVQLAATDKKSLTVIGLVKQDTSNDLYLQATGLRTD